MWILRTEEGAEPAFTFRILPGNIRTIGRATQGVRLIDIEGEDRAVSIARLAEKDDEAIAEPPLEPEPPAEPPSEE